MLVKKSYTERRHRRRRRLWKLRQLEKETEPGVQRGRQRDLTMYEKEYEEFMQDLEEDPSMRSQVNLYRDEEAIEAQQAKDARIAAERERAQMVKAGEAAGVQVVPVQAASVMRQATDEDQFGDDEREDDDAEDDGFPDVKLDELLDELTISAGDEAGGEEDESAAASSSQQPVDEGPEPGPLGPISFAPPPPTVAQFELPGGNDNAKFFFGAE